MVCRVTFCFTVFIDNIATVPVVSVLMLAVDIAIDFFLDCLLELSGSRGTYICVFVGVDGE